MKICVVGVGYVGYPMCLLLAKAGHRILGVDTNPEVVACLNRKTLHLAEPGVDELAADPEVQSRLRGAESPEPADVFVIAVPTPLKKPRKVAEVGIVEAAARAIAPHLRPGNLVILESTVPPRTCKDVLEPIFKAVGYEAGKNLLLAHCPERVLPGRALFEIVHNDRIIGGVNVASTEAAAALYATFVKGEIVKTDDITAEFCKLIENTYRDVNIALANELARVARTLGVDITKAIETANRHPRVNLLNPGIGVGGHCIPIDPWFIAEVDPESCRLIVTARQINDYQPHVVAGLIRREVRDVPDPYILCLGATYRADIEDLREAPALEIFHMLQDDGYHVQMFDPITEKYGGRDLYALARGAHLLAVLVPHRRMMAEIESNRGRLAGILARDRVIDFSLGTARPV
jgi:UDP-N-acetyl-D-mannosaminuronic acid dehydrogenase